MNLVDQFLEKLSKQAGEAINSTRTANWTGSEGPFQTQEPLTAEERVAKLREVYDPVLRQLLDCREVLDHIIGVEGPLPKIHKDHINRGTTALTVFDATVESVLKK